MAAAAWWQQRAQRAMADSEQTSRHACGMMACTVRSGAGEWRRARTERVEREKWSTVLTWIFLQIFNWNEKKFEHESCREFQILQLPFQAQAHLKPRSRVKFELLMKVHYCRIRFKFKIFFNFYIATWKFLSTKVVQHLKLYNLGFGQKFIWAMV